MKITNVRLGRISVPLRTPFKTALRTVNSVEDVIVEIHTDCGAVGYGEAPPTGAITGDTTGAIIGAIQDHIAKTIIGRDVDEFETLLQSVQKCIVGNTSAKAAVDMALWDLYGQLYNIPAYKLMGGAAAKAPAKVEPAITRRVVRFEREVPLRYIFAGLCAVMLLVFCCVHFADGGIILQWMVGVFTGLFGRNVYLVSMPALVVLIWNYLARKILLYKK